MGKKEAKNHKPFFMFLLQSITEMMGPEMSKGILQRVGTSLADSVLKKFGEESLNVDNLNELITGSENPLTYLDDTLEINEDKLLLLGGCPFKKVLDDYVSLEKNLPPMLNEIKDIYNHEGLGYAVSPYCIIHQEYRKRVAKNIKVGGKNVDFLQLGCKSASGEIVYGEDNISAIGKSQEEIEENLNENACTYSLQEK